MQKVVAVVVTVALAVTVAVAVAVAAVVAMVAAAVVLELVSWGRGARAGETPAFFFFLPFLGSGL